MPGGPVRRPTSPIPPTGPGPGPEISTFPVDRHGNVITKKDRQGERMPGGDVLSWSLWRRDEVPRVAALFPREIQFHRRFAPRRLQPLDTDVHHGQLRLARHGAYLDLDVRTRRFGGAGERRRLVPH